MQLGDFFDFDRVLKKCICEGKKSYKDDSSDEENEVATTQSPFGDLGNLTKTSLSSELSGHVSFFLLRFIFVLAGWFLYSMFMNYLIIYLKAPEISNPEFLIFTNCSTNWIDQIYYIST